MEFFDKYENVVVGQHMEVIRRKKSYLIANASGPVVFGTIASATIRSECVVHLVDAAVSSRSLYFIRISCISNNYLFLIPLDCQNRFAMNVNTNNHTPSSQVSKHNNVIQSAQSTSNVQSTNRKLFDDDTYDTFGKSLFSTAKSCYESKSDDNTTHRKLLEAYNVGLSRIYEDLEKRSNQK